MNGKINVAIDGPAGAGKSTVAKAVSARLGYIYVDTGALYRAVGLYALRNVGDGYSAEDVIKLLDGLDVKIKFAGGVQRVFNNGEDVSDFIRTPEVTSASSFVSSIPEVREFLFELQKRLANENDVVMDGRDIGTVVLPEAEVKIFLTASAEERAKRRFAEMESGEQTYEEVLEAIKKRDYDDSHRDIAPLKPADDAVFIDTDGLSLEQSIDKVLEAIENKIK